MRLAMSKRRVPGHLNRRPRRRDDARPNVPAAPAPIEPAADAVAPAQPATTPSGRPLRPTQRIGPANRFARSAAPPAEVEIDYAQVIGDLRQIAFFAAIAFAVLILLAIVI